VAGLLNQISREWASTPCDPFPCGAEVWSYACRATGVAVMELPEHKSRRAVFDLLHREGGLVPYAARLLASIGWDRVDAPERGDVGVVVINGMGKPAAICLTGGRDPKWMAKGDALVLVTPARQIAAWRKPCRKPSPPSLSEQLA